MTPEQEEAHDALLKEMQSHLALGGVEPPDNATAAAGTMRDEPDSSPDDFKSYPGPAPAMPKPEPRAAPAFDTSQQVMAPRPPKPAGDDEMAGAKATDDKSRAMGKLGQAVTAFTERPSAFLSRMTGAGSGGEVRPQHNAMWDDQAANGDKAVADLMARRKADADREAKSSAAGAAAMRKDPNSPQAKFVRDFLGTQAPELVGKLDGKSIDDMAVIFPWVPKLIEENSAGIKAKATRDAEGAKTKAASEKEAAELDSWKKVMAERYPEHAKELNSITTMKAANDYQGALEGDKTRASNERAAAMKAGTEAATDIPPGYEVSGGAHPGTETRKSFTKLVSSAEKMKGLTAQMREALKGTTGLSRTFDPATVTKLKQLGTMISIEGKNVAGLGALSGPDMGLMDSIAADPTSIKANLTVDLPRMLDQLDAWGDNSVASESKASGIVRSGGHGGAATPTTSTGTKTPTKYLVSPDRKLRVPVYADGTEGPEEAMP